MSVTDERVGAVLTALADPTRRWLFGALVEVGHGSATALSRDAPVSRQAVVKHLQVLEGAGLVTGARSGREVLWTAHREPLEESARWLTELASTWDRRLEHLKGRAEG